MFDSAFWLALNNIGVLVFEFFFYGTARVAVPLLSFGKVVVDDFYLEDSGFNWIGLKRREDGRYVMNSDVSKLAAVAFWVLCLAAYAVYTRGF
ncbi:hypothetical protein [Sinorhizobium chiapasense]|uniref:Transmembrane protein n=1 Tax=Sinorhizobium chiapasense TaxID=501572 RepID=A0ABZ2BHK5_9HYPH